MPPNLPFWLLKFFSCFKAYSTLFSSVQLLLDSLPICIHHFILHPLRMDYLFLISSYLYSALYYNVLYWLTKTGQALNSQATFTHFAFVIFFKMPWNTHTRRKPRSRNFVVWPRSYDLLLLQIIWGKRYFIFFCTPSEYLWNNIVQ